MARQFSRTKARNLYLNEGAGNVTAKKLPGVNRYVEQVEAFVRLIRDDTPYLIPLEFSQGTQGFIYWVYETAKWA